MADPVDEFSELIDRLRSMDPYKFERLVGALWEQQGYQVQLQPASRDRGIDIVARKADPFPRKQLLQTKRYSDGNTIGSQVIRQYGTLYQQDRESKTVAIITTSRFSREAQQLAQDLQVELVDGTQLCKLLIEHAPHLSQELFESEDSREEDGENIDSARGRGTKYGHLVTRKDSNEQKGDDKPDTTESIQTDSRIENPVGTTSSYGSFTKEGMADIVDRYLHMIEDLDSK